MNVEMILLLVDGGVTLKGADGVYRPTYDCIYTETQVRKGKQGHEWAYVNGAWTLIRTNRSGTRYVITSNI
jgi:hypothetical protein